MPFFKIRIQLLLFNVLLILLPTGVLAVDFKWNPSLNVREEYNDNISFSYSGSEDDYITTISAGLAMTARTEQLDLRLAGIVSSFFYADNIALDNVDQNYVGGINHQVSPLMVVNANLSYNVSNRQDRDIYTTGVVTSDNRRERYALGIGLNYTLTEIDAMAISFNYSFDKWDDILNQNNKDYRTSVNYRRNLNQWLNNTTARLNIRFAWFEFDTNETYNYSTTIGVERGLSQTVNLIIDMGFTYTDANFLSPQLVFVPPSSTQVNIVETNNKTYSGTGQAILAIKGELTNGSVSIRHGIEPASGTRTTVQRTNAALNVQRKLTERSAVAISTGLFHNRADRDEFSFFEIDEDTFYFNPSIQWQFSKDFIIGIGYNFIYIDDHKVSTDRKQNVVYLQASYGITLFE